MNSQLFAHLAAFDSCESSSEQTSDCLSSLGDDAKTTDVDDANVNGHIESSQTNNDVNDKCGTINLCESLAIYFPVVVVFLIPSSHNEGLIGFLVLVLASFAWLVSWQKQQSQSQLQPKSRVESSHSSRQQEKKPLKKSIAPSYIRKKNCIQDIYEIRNELSRLLGLIGAPPMGVRNYSDNPYYDIDFRFEACDQLDVHGSILRFVGKENQLADATTSVVSFLEAHVQMVLTIDKALHWVRICSSLHWGLGSHSNCVERVERAAISKELFSARRRSTDHQDNPKKDPDQETDNCTSQTSTSPSSVHAKATRMNQPQSRIDSSSILALSSARRNIAHVIVKEINSIVETYRIFENESTRQRLKNESYDAIHTFGHADGYEENNIGTESMLDHTGVGERDDYHVQHVKNDFFEMPVVVDISWIKASRKYIANLLADVVEKFSSWQALSLLSMQAGKNLEVSQLPSSGPLQALHESMWTARNLRGYLTSHLLLDDDDDPSRRLGSVYPISYGCGVGKDQKLVLPIMEYRKHLDALDAALRSFQQHIYSQDVDADSSPTSGTRSRQNLPQTFDQYNLNKDSQTMLSRSSAAQLTWWNQVKEISAACQTLEEEIGRNFFSSSDDGYNGDIEGERDVVDGNNMPLNSERNTAHETQNYEHIEGETSSSSEGSRLRSLKTTKTLVFSGEGSKEKQITSKRKQKAMVVDDSGTTELQLIGGLASAPLPTARDPFAEQLLVRELQKRIRSVAALREEEQVDPCKIEFQAMAGEEEHQNETIDEQSSVDPDYEFHSQMNRIDGGDQVVFRKPAVVTNIFLGASGSLLEELKMNINAGPDADMVLGDDEEEQVKESNEMDAYDGASVDHGTTFVSDDI